MATIWAVVNGIQDYVLVKLDKISSNEESELAGIRHDLDKIRMKYETQFKLLSNKLDHLSRDHECVETNVLKQAQILKGS